MDLSSLTLIATVMSAVAAFLNWLAQHSISKREARGIVLDIYERFFTRAGRAVEEAAAAAGLIVHCGDFEALFVCRYLKQLVQMAAVGGNMNELALKTSWRSKRSSLKPSPSRRSVGRSAWSTAGTRRGA